jgi:PIN domain nuclease of toxin-antitoxin system
MNIILDTHCFIYSIEGNRSAFSEKALSIILDKTNHIFLSLASVWEMQVKIQIGKLKLENELSKVIDEQLQTNDLRLLTISANHIYNLSQLPFHHKDPFDRIIISQAMTEGFSLLSKDAQISKYQVNVIW